MKKHAQMTLTIQRRAWICLGMKVDLYTSDYLRAELASQIGHIRYILLSELEGQ